MAARPRGGDWLAEEISSWRREGVNTALAKPHGMRFLSFPISDRQVPASEKPFAEALEDLAAELAAGRNVVLHCRQGIGRTGLVAACLLVTKGVAPESAVRELSAARDVPVPDTEEQRTWIDRFANACHHRVETWSIKWEH